MAPRSYTLRRRAATSAETRQRIIDAAIAEYRERGIPAATLKAIAARADVSRGTVLNHFGDADGVLLAVLDSAVGTLDIPTEQIFVGCTTRDERVRAFVDAMFRFYDRTSDWWTVFAGDRNELPKLPAFEAAEASFWTEVARLQAAAFEDAATDRIVVATAGALMHPWTVGQLQWTGLSLDEAIDVVGGLVVELVRSRSDKSGSSHRRQVSILPPEAGERGRGT